MNRSNFNACRPRRAALRCAELGIVLLGLVGQAAAALGQSDESMAVRIPIAVDTDTIDFPQASRELRLIGNADQASQWQLGSWSIYHLHGNVQLAHGTNRYACDEAIVWIDNAANGSPHRDVVIYLESNVVIDLGELGVGAEANGANQFRDQQWLGRLQVADLAVGIPVTPIPPEQAPAIFERARRQRDGNTYPVQPARYQAPTDGSGLTLVTPLNGNVEVLPGTQPARAPGAVLPPVIPLPPRAALTGGVETTRVEFVQLNSNIGGNVRGFQGQNPGEQVLVYTGGARVNIDGRDVARLNQLGQPTSNRLVIQADNIIAWVNPITAADGSTSSRYEIYLEGNVVFSTGSRVIYAERMYYDATYRRGTILTADVLTPVPGYEGLLRLKADVVQQTGEDRYEAFGAAVTSSRLGVPRYWLQSDQVTLTGQATPQVDPLTGIPMQAGNNDADREWYVESRSNTVYVGGIPVFYWPVIAADLNDPSYYIDRVRLGSDRVLGTQLGVGLDMFQLLGIRSPDVRWVGLADYLSERGFGFGSDVDYQLDSFLGYPGQVNGFGRFWFIDDSGLDNLGRDRRNVPLEESFRGRALARQSWMSPAGWRLRAELGYLSDRNFLQQYFERDWDTGKDYTTGLWWERNRANRSLNVIADFQVNDFFTQTQWLPRLDHYILGQSLFGDRAVWHGRTTIGYAQFRTAEAPVNPVDLAKFDPLAWEGADRDGVVASTRHELDVPFQLGALRVVPYVLGDVTYQEQDLTGASLLRTLGQTGVRTSLPMWRADPTICNPLLNISGLAHKVSWESEFLYADASENLGQMALYHELDDDAQEFFRRRFAFDTFGILPGMDVPLRFDERWYAYRSLMQSNVTAPAPEIADDLMVVRTGFRNRWQTKRGLPGEARVIDWIRLDVHASYFPEADRDNFGEELGVVDYDFEWFVGDRFSILSDGYADVFSQGLRTVSVGANINRPGVGNLYVGMRSIEGPISSNLLTVAATYRMSDKWILQGNSTVDFGSAGNIGQALSFTRVGESFLIRFGVNADFSRDNVGFLFGIEPRFFPDGRLGIVGGRRVLPASANYLE